jgi:hypothetical protein
MGILGLFFFLFVGFYSSHHELAYNYNILLFNLTGDALFWYTDKKKWIYNGSLFNLLCLVVYLFMMMNKTHLLIVSPLIYEWRSIELALKTKASDYYLNKVTQKVSSIYPITISE